MPDLTEDAVVVIDADLQDPPELIVEFVAAWREGYDVVYGQRTRRDGESFVKLLSAHAFCRAHDGNRGFRLRHCGRDQDAATW